MSTWKTVSITALLLMLFRRTQIVIYPGLYPHCSYHQEEINSTLYYSTSHSMLSSKLYVEKLVSPSMKTSPLIKIHTLRVHYAHAAANLNSGYSKYAKQRRHYFCTIALRTSRAVLRRARASCRVDLFSKRVIIFCW